jgi:hypothetical protein
MARLVTTIVTCQLIVFAATIACAQPALQVVELRVSRGDSERFNIVAHQVILVAGFVAEPFF